MKTNDATHPSTLSFASCDALLKKLGQVRTQVTGEFAARLREFEPMLHLALNEAESLAFQTPYPHLVFPTLAEEKAKALVQWASRQHRARTRSALVAA
jgi:hypothetical protein